MSTQCRKRSLQKFGQLLVHTVPIIGLAGGCSMTGELSDMKGTRPLPSDHFSIVRWYQLSEETQVVLEFNSLSSFVSFSYVQAREASDQGIPALEVTIFGYVEEPELTPANALPIRRIDNGNYCAEIKLPSPVTPELRVLYVEGDQRTPIEFTSRLEAPFPPYVPPEMPENPF